jgi:hypothetical protein
MEKKSANCPYRLIFFTHSEETCKHSRQIFESYECGSLFLSKQAPQSIVFISLFSFCILESSFTVGRGKHIPVYPDTVDNLQIPKDKIPYMLKEHLQYFYERITNANEKTAFYAEYNNKGKGSVATQRVKWAKQLSPKQARKYTREAVLGDWNPEK